MVIRETEPNLPDAQRRIDGTMEARETEPDVPDVGRLVDGIDHQAFWRVLARFAGTLVHRFELDDVLRQLASDIRDVLGVAGAGVMLADDDGDLHFTSASDAVLDELEALQIRLGEGPCLYAYRSGEIVLASDLRTDQRFTRFGPLAIAAGMAAVFSFPMHIDDGVIGALNLYRGEPGDLSADQVEAGLTFADVATTYLANARDSEQKDLLTKQLQHALNSRVVIEQAKGYVSATADVDLPDAFELLRTYARTRQLRVRLIARGVLSGELPVDELREG